MESQPSISASERIAAARLSDQTSDESRRAMQRPGMLIKEELLRGICQLSTRDRGEMYTNPRFRF